MSFGFSVGDIVLLVQLAHKTFCNCQQAGTEYLEIATEVRCLHSVLRFLREEARRPGSKIFKQDDPSTAQLVNIVSGCKNVLGSLDEMLSKYDGLRAGSKSSTGKKLTHRVMFGSKIEDLGVIRGKLITYTSTISVLPDTMQLQGTERLATKVDGGFAEMKTQFELLRTEIYTVASQKRAEERMDPAISSLSLSTYAGNEKAVWQEFRHALMAKGFRSDILARHEDALQAYKMRLDQSGILDEERDTTQASRNSMPLCGSNSAVNSTAVLNNPQIEAAFSSKDLSLPTSDRVADSEEVKVDHPITGSIIWQTQLTSSAKEDNDPQTTPIPPLKERGDNAEGSIQHRDTARVKPSANALICREDSSTSPEAKKYPCDLQSAAKPKKR